MGMDIIKSKSPLWTGKLNDEQLCKYLDALNEFELRGSTDSELLHNTANMWYSNATGIEKLLLLSIDVYKEAAFRWYEEKEQ